MVRVRKKTTKGRLAHLVQVVTSHGYTTEFEVENGKHAGLTTILEAGKPEENLTIEGLRTRFVTRLKKVAADPATMPATIPMLIERRYIGEVVAMV